MVRISQRSAVSARIFSESLIRPARPLLHRYLTQIGWWRSRQWREWVRKILVWSFFAGSSFLVSGFLRKPGFPTEGIKRREGARPDVPDRLLALADEVDQLRPASSSRGSLFRPPVVHSRTWSRRQAH